MQHPPDADLTGLFLAIARPALEAAQFRQGLTLLSQQVAELVAEVGAAERDDVLRALEVTFELLLQLLGGLGLGANHVQLGDRLGDLVRQRGVLIGELDHERGRPFRVKALGLGGVLDLLGLGLPFGGDQCFQQRHTLTERAAIGRRLVAPCLQQLDPRRLTQELLVEHLDLGAEGIGLGLQHPAPRLGLGRRLLGGGRQLLLRLVLALRGLGLLQALADQRRPRRLCIETLDEVLALCIGGGEIGLLLLQLRLQVVQRGRVADRRELL